MPDAERIVEWLEEKDAIREGKSPWRGLSDNEDAYLIDWSQIFPSEGEEEREFSRQWKSTDVWAEKIEYQDFCVNPEQEALTTFRQRLQHAGTMGRPSDAEARIFSEQPLWDSCAWYQPMHYFADGLGNIHSGRLHREIRANGFIAFCLVLQKLTPDLLNKLAKSQPRSFVSSRTVSP